MFQWRFCFSACDKWRAIYWCVRYFSLVQGRDGFCSDAEPCPLTCPHLCGADDEVVFSDLRRCSSPHCVQVIQHCWVSSLTAHTGLFFTRHWELGAISRFSHRTDFNELNVWKVWSPDDDVPNKENNAWTWPCNTGAVKRRTQLPITPDSHPDWLSCFYLEKNKSALLQYSGAKIPSSVRCQRTLETK